jgi:hypothetical protein
VETRHPLHASLFSKMIHGLGDEKYDEENIQAVAEDGVNDNCVPDYQKTDGAMETKNYNRELRVANPITITEIRHALNACDNNEEAEAGC